MTKALIAIAAIIIIGAGAYYFIGVQGGMGGNENATSTPQTASGNSLSSLVAAGAPVTCNYSTTTSDGTQTTGTIYVANGMVAADLSSNTRAGNIQTHMVVRDNTSYLWTSASNQGFKSTITTAGQTGQQGIDYNSPADYSCQGWTPDSAKFNLPTNISFVSSADFAAPPQGAGATGAGGGTQGNAQQCAACNQLSGAQKAQCLAALQCQ